MLEFQKFFLKLSNSETSGRMKNLQIIKSVDRLQERRKKILLLLQDFRKKNIQAKLIVLRAWRTQSHLLCTITLKLRVGRKFFT